jgi:hypothetical protein
VGTPCNPELSSTEQPPAFLSRGMSFKLRAVHAEFIIGKAVLGQDFLRELGSSPPVIISHSHLSTWDGTMDRSGAALPRSVLLKSHTNKRTGGWDISSQWPGKLLPYMEASQGLSSAQQPRCSRKVKIKTENSKCNQKYNLNFLKSLSDFCYLMGFKLLVSRFIRRT